ncbi:ribosome biogenesis/translation initiation ATPase RLI [Methanoregula sp.]|uniref:ribosome biogenesis/translation initiation ATPase RLI n=1 Tax=Methanoregula sp. TaxID=2052170 RepID=UPI0023705744|nr:ribosome biogenesis/translation initiation ATPase RLI [Methanoregula sp.]MDD1687051.1 ribosome biogenesis/translation initiation ATPase RLI [Methanoregula sp.]
MRIAIVHKDRCHAKKCGNECIIYCPRVRTGDETVIIGADGKAEISEELCVGCGICIKKCPFDAIDIVSLPEELEHPTHRYGKNGFALYGLPIPVEGKVTGILGANGIGKSTAIKILSGQLRPNLGNFDNEVAWEEILKLYSGTELFDYLQTVSKKTLKIATKPQYIDFIPKVFSGTVRALLTTTDERGRLGEILPVMKLDSILDHDIGTLSGGELQRVAIAACLARDADLYFLDEITPFLDIYQRIAAAKLIRDLATERPVVIVEHDLAILDMLADTVHVGYGKPAVFGIITRPKGVRVGINQYLEGFLAEENVRFRDSQVVFEKRAHEKGSNREDLVVIPAMTKKFENFELTVGGGTIRAGEVLGIVGANGTGKSTFAKLLAGVETPTTGTLDTTLKISYKPQYIKADTSDTVEMYLRGCTTKFDSSIFQHEILETLSLNTILQSPVDSLSGGELQRVAIAACLSRDADLYILDEPSAHLDVEQRVRITRMIKRHAEGKEVGILVIDHDIYVIDMISERILVFDGEPGASGMASGPYLMRDGMNRFLRELDVTFRRDQSGRPRINKPDSFLDREQKSLGEFYYYAQDDD